MNPALVCLPILILPLLLPSSTAQAADILEEAIDYSNIPPAKRERDRAVELLQQAEKSVNDLNSKAELNLRIARMFTYGFNHQTELAVPSESIRYCKIAKAYLKSSPTLLSSQIEMELARACDENGDASEATAICQAIIATPSSALYPHELTEELLQKLREPSPIAGPVDADSEPFKTIVNDRIARVKAGIDYKYHLIQESAVRRLSTLTFKSGGLPALKQLAETMSDAQLKKIVEDILKQKPSSP